MTPIQIIAQVIGIFAMACNILSYQQKKQSRLIFCQLLGGALFSLNFFLLGATTGAILNVTATIRAVLFLFEKKLRTSHPAWLYGSIACYIGIYALSLTVLCKELKPILFLIELLPVIGMTAISVAFMLGNSRMTRRLGLIASPAWLIYNIYYFSIGAICCEVFSLVSIVLGMLRHDKKQKSSEQTNILE